MKQFDCLFDALHYAYGDTRLSDGIWELFTSGNISKLQVQESIYKTIGDFKIVTNINVIFDSTKDLPIDTIGRFSEDNVQIEM